MFAQINRTSQATGAPLLGLAKLYIMHCVLCAEAVLKTLLLPN